MGQDAAGRIDAQAGALIDCIDIGGSARRIDGERDRRVWLVSLPSLA
jgi:hypothetical protein